MSDRYFDNSYPDHAVDTSFQIREQFIKDLIQNYYNSIISPKFTNTQIQKFTK